MDRDELIRVMHAFEEQNLEYAIIGATAMGFHGLVRATEDVDLLIRPTPENVERLRQALKATYANDANIEDFRTEDLLGEYPAVRYHPESSDTIYHGFFCLETIRGVEDFTDNGHRTTR